MICMCFFMLLLLIIFILEFGMFLGLIKKSTLLLFFYPNRANPPIQTDTRRIHHPTKLEVEMDSIGLRFEHLNFNRIDTFQLETNRCPSLLFTKALLLAKTCAANLIRTISYNNSDFVALLFHHISLLLLIFFSFTYLFFLIFFLLPFR